MHGMEQLGWKRNGVQWANCGGSGFLSLASAFRLGDENATATTLPWARNQELIEPNQQPTEQRDFIFPIPSYPLISYPYPIGNH